jgi:antitoxin FitA
VAKRIQIRNVPDALYRKLGARAAREGLSLSAFLLAEARRIAESPSLDEIRQRIASRASVRLDVPAAKAIRQLRDSR